MNAHFRSINAILILILVVFATGCDAFSSKSDDESGFVTLSGQVLNEATNNPVSSAFVRVLPYDLLFEVGQDGSYAFDVEIDSTMELDVSASAEGYRPVSLPVLAIAGRTISVPTFRLTQVVEQQATSGSASNIILESQTLATIGVRESGSAELAGLTFQLADSLGNPIVLSQAATVNFRFGVQPGGGEFLSPSSVLTDNNGIATVNLSSGTKAGVVQVIAESTVNGRVIRSQPVAITIHGGMPDQAHFSLGPAKRNFPGLNLFGTTNVISVIVGDKYSNPVRVGSSVYFDTSHGIIEGSTITDSQGQGSVTLISANPLPPDGIAHIRAFTADDQQNSVSALTPVVFSGTPVITVNPGTAAINQTYNYTVTDYNGNPLAAGTSITVSAEGTAVRAVGHTSTRLDDTVFIGGNDYQHVVRGAGITEFTFRVIDNVDPLNPEVPVLEVITISVSGPNGSLEVVLGGSGAPYSRTDGVEMVRTSDGLYRFELAGNPIQQR
jgi:hypothetical protein